MGCRNCGGRRARRSVDQVEAQLKQAQAQEAIEATRIAAKTRRAIARAKAEEGNGYPTSQPQPPEVKVPGSSTRGPLPPIAKQQTVGRRLSSTKKRRGRKPASGRTASCDENISTLDLSKSIGCQPPSCPSECDGAEICITTSGCLEGGGCFNLAQTFSTDIKLSVECPGNGELKFSACRDSSITFKQDGASTANPTFNANQATDTEIEFCVDWSKFPVCGDGYLEWQGSCWTLDLDVIAKDFDWSKFPACSAGGLKWENNCWKVDWQQLPICSNLEWKDGLLCVTKECCEGEASAASASAPAAPEELSASAFTGTESLTGWPDSHGGPRAFGMINCDGEIKAASRHPSGEGHNFVVREVNREDDRFEILIQLFTQAPSTNLCVVASSPEGHVKALVEDRSDIRLVTAEPGDISFQLFF